MSDTNMTDSEMSFFEEIKSYLRLYMFSRRYQKIKAGQLTWEERLLSGPSSVQRLALGRMIRARFVVAWRKTVKRLVDMIVSYTAIVCSVPLMLLIALAIKLTSKGPVLFVQNRVGLRGKTFNMYKFRSMTVDAEAGTGPVWAKKVDPRVTVIGKFLRKAHLDELPQFFNVLMGEMSVVGPRPERPYFVSELRKEIPHYDRRLAVKPGITGLAQIKHHYDETIRDVKKKLRYDVLYVRRTCPLLDFKVIGLTVLTVFFGTGR